MRRIVTVSLVALLLAGCGPKKKSGVVTGKITYDGKPVNGPALLLYPAGGGADAAPVTIPVTQDGEYRISDVATGEYKIVVQGTAGAQQANPNLLKAVPKEKQAEMKAKLDAMSTPATIPFPNKYKDPKTTDLKVSVTDKDQTLDLQLTGPAPANTPPRKEL
jgi:hypothetical protein